MKYFSLTRGANRGYTFSYFACEFLNLLVDIGELFFINYFVGGEFFTYGIEAIQLHFTDHHNRIDKMNTIFPKHTKCLYKNFGTSGSLQTIDGVCVLPLNVVNEKIFLFIFFYLALVIIITSVHLLYRVASCLMPFVRINQILAKVCI